MQHDSPIENETDASRWNGSTAADPDTLFTVLADRYRRETLVTLRAEDEPVSLRTLTARIEGDDDQTQLLLRHVHLPMLADSGLITWNRTRESVEMDTVPDEYLSALDSIYRTTC
ncbi:DUF7344 domain-containing protein [Haladaptatus sp. NG-WS-4]